MYDSCTLNVCLQFSGLDFMDNSGTRVDYENALINAGFGKFHFYLLIVCGMIYMNTAIGITIISFVLPSATCDFRMSSSDKGLLTAAPMLGKLAALFYQLHIWLQSYLFILIFMNLNRFYDYKEPKDYQHDIVFCFCFSTSMILNALH